MVKAKNILILAPEKKSKSAPLDSGPYLFREYPSVKNNL